MDYVGRVVRVAPAVVVALALASGVGCSRGDDSREQVRPPEKRTPVGPTAPHARKVPRVFDVVGNLERCDARHRGVLFDLGTPAVEGLSGYRLAPLSGVASVERDGATWGRITAREISYRFLLDDPQSIFVSARVRGLSSRSATVTIDGKTLGTLAFSKNQTRTVSTPLSSAALPAGPHTLAVRFSGSSRDGVDPFAEVDWLRVGFPDDDPTSFAAPTLRDVAQNVALSSVPHRGLAMRAPGAIRCTLGIPEGAHAKLAVGLQGAGEGEAEVRMLVDGRAPAVLKTVRLIGGDRAAWTDLDLPLSAFVGQLATIELAATGSTRGARVVFGDPLIVGAEMPDATTPPAKAVVIVVLTAVDPWRVPPWSPDRPLPTFATLAREGAVFENHRSPSTLVSSVMASLLTGLPPSQHAVVDAYARLPASLPTLATVAREASVRTAMFTSNPATFEAFGFARGWDRYTMHSPVSPALGTAPIDEIGAWVAEKDQRPEKGVLAVAHARGIHPPYDMPPGEFAQLPPQDYNGTLDPRRAGQVLEKMRQKKRAPAKWTDGDRLRLAGMMDAALVQTDRSLSNLIDALRKAGLWNDTLLIVTSDVGSAVDPAPLPFAENLDITEDTLAMPLYVRFPGGALAGARIKAPTSLVDVARTALAALGIDQGGLGGVDLFALAERGIAPMERPLVATLGDRYATRWGNYRLVGREGATPTLCLLDADPRCEKDVAPLMPLSTFALFRHTWDHEAAGWKQPRPRRDPATIDPETAAAMAVWGR